MHNFVCKGYNNQNHKISGQKISKQVLMIGLAE